MLTLVAGLLGFSGAPAAAAGPAGWAESCGGEGLEFAPVQDRDRHNDGSPIEPVANDSGSFVPVVYVHGWTATSRNVPDKGAFSWIPDLSSTRAGGVAGNKRTLIGNVQELPGAAVFTFDYGKYASRWVTDDHIGPALAGAIDCLHETSGQKVIIVGHSMGGLAARQAMSMIKDPASKVSQVITFGTPNGGSILAAILAGATDLGANASKEGAILRLWLSHCGQVKSQDQSADSVLCPALLPPFITSARSQAARALAAGSKQMRALPGWPKGVPVHALAGDMDFTVAGMGFFRQRETSKVGMGDFIVSLGSSVKGSTNQRMATCEYDLDVETNARDAALVALQLRTRDEVRRGWSNMLVGDFPCFHTNLMRETHLALEQFGLIVDDINSRAPATELVTVEPWKDGRADAADHEVDGQANGGPGTDGVCLGSELARRYDGFRCFAQDGVYDPCFQNPDDPTSFACFFVDQTIVLRNMGIEWENTEVDGPGESAVFAAVLEDGTICRAGTGAGPDGIPGYDYWRGQCWGKHTGIWRLREEDPGPLYDETDGGVWFVAIEEDTNPGVAKLYPVKTAYR